MRLTDCAFAAAFLVTLTIMGSLAYRAAQQGALPLLPQHYGARP